MTNGRHDRSPDSDSSSAIAAAHPEEMQGTVEFKPGNLGTITALLC